MADLPLRRAGRCGISWRDGASPGEMEHLLERWSISWRDGASPGGDASPQGFQTRIHGENCFQKMMRDGDAGYGRISP